MTKQNIKRNLDSDYLYEIGELTLRQAADKLIKLSEQYEEKGFENISFEIDYDGEYRRLLINGYRLETDEEVIAREKAEARCAEVSREHDLKMFKTYANLLGINIDSINEL